MFTKNEAVGPGEGISHHPCDIGGMNLAIAGTIGKLTIKATNGKKEVDFNFKDRRAPDGKYFKTISFSVVPKARALIIAPNQDPEAIKILEAEDIDTPVEGEDVDLEVEFDVDRF